MKPLLTILIVVSLSGCASLHERFCESTLAHYQDERKAVNAQVYYNQYKETCQ